MDVSHRSQTHPLIHTLLIGRVWAISSTLLVTFFVVYVLFSIPYLLDHPEQILPDHWTRAQLETVLMPVGIPVTWLVWTRLLLEMTFTVTAVVTSAIIFQSQPKESFSYSVAFWLVLHGTFSGIFADSIAALSPTLIPLGRSLLMLGWFGLLVLAYVFPTGTFVPRWTAITIPLFIVVFVLLSSSYAFGQGEPLPFVAGLLLVLAFGGIVAQGYRFRRVSTPTERQQTKWVWFAITIRLVYVIIISIPTIRAVLLSVSPQGLAAQIGTMVLSFSIAGLLPIAVGVAILRYRLWDIDLFLNRALVYSCLTLFIVGSYIAIVGGIGALLGTQQISPLLSIIATGVVAISFQPLRTRLQRAVSQLIYGERDEPYRVLTRLGQRLEAAIDPSSALSLTVESIATSLKLPYAAIHIKRSDQIEIAAAHGAPRDNLNTISLIYAGETIGELVVSSRTPNEALTSADHQFLIDLARQISITAHAARLSADLEQARLRMVTSREETRRRLGSDLHDGVGHTLAGLARQMEMAMRLMDHEPTRARATFIEISQQLNITIEQVRGLAHQLHPPELELLGLIGALRERAETHPKLKIHLDTPPVVPPLSVAVETAVYYIVLEALTNIEKHAEAKSCHIRIALSSSELNYQPSLLEIDIMDDGKGFPPTYTYGLGLLSMQARAAEVGGICRVESSSQGGTRVNIHLPHPSHDI